MLADLKHDRDGGLVIYIQGDSLNSDREANRLRLGTEGPPDDPPNPRVALFAQLRQTDIGSVSHSSVRVSEKT
jgi:hypothetical protein